MRARGARVGLTASLGKDERHLAAEAVLQRRRPRYPSPSPKRHLKLRRLCSSSGNVHVPNPRAGTSGTWQLRLCSLSSEVTCGHASRRYFSR